MELLAPDAVGQLEQCTASGVLRSDPRASCSVTSSRASPSSNRFRRIGASLCIARRWLRSPTRCSPSRSRPSRASRRSCGRRRSGASSSHPPPRSERRLSVRTARPPRSTRLLSASPTAARPKRLGEWLERRAYECYRDQPVGRGARRAGTGARVSSSRGRSPLEGDARSLSFASRPHVGRTDEAMAAGQEAVTVLEALPPGAASSLSPTPSSRTSSCGPRTRSARCCGPGARSSSLSASAMRESLSYALLNIGTVELDSSAMHRDGRRSSEASTSVGGRGSTNTSAVCT